MSPEAAERSRQLSNRLSARPVTWLDRFLVLDECESTQDEAWAKAAGKSGLVLSSLRQSKGRGRPGKAWDQRADLGLAVTFVLSRTAHDASMLSLRAACATCLACEAAVGSAELPPDSGLPLFRIKWPNDVMVSRDARSRQGTGQKLAGMLVEARDDLLLLGIGINVRQRDSDWSEPLRAVATSLTQLCESTPHPDHVLLHLIEALDQTLFAPRTQVLQQFAMRDIVTGSRRIFESGNRRFEGVVESIDPDGDIRLRQNDGNTIAIPAAASTLVPEAPHTPHL